MDPCPVGGQWFLIPERLGIDHDAPAEEVDVAFDQRHAEAEAGFLPGSRA
jgi:hypothetical protein